MIDFRTLGENKMPALLSYLITGLLTLFAAYPAHADSLSVGDRAPSFDLMDQNSERHTLDKYRGQWLVLYFYPKNDTPGCTTEACEFRDDIFILRRMGVVVAGVSLDDVKSHQEFAKKYSLPFPLLSDATGETAESYGALMSLGPVRFAKRNTFIIGPDSRIAKIYRSVDPKTHSDEVIADLKGMGIPDGAG